MTSVPTATHYHPQPFLARQGVGYRVGSSTTKQGAAESSLLQTPSAVLIGTLPVAHVQLVFVWVAELMALK